MSKLLLLAILILILLGVFTGVFEVKVRLDKIGSVPSALQETFGDGNIGSQAEYFFTVWKRKAEIAFANTENKKFEYYMKYVEQDTKKLKEMMDANKDPEIVIQQSNLLNESLTSAKSSVEKISKEALQEWRDAWVKILANANIELARLSLLAGKYKQLQEQIEKIIPSSASPTPKIELKF
ncbi:MAG: hypothetical protein O3A36_03550 [bacterium]|nr:hypothetical protein [bacterium]